MIDNLFNKYRNYETTTINISFLYIYSSIYLKLYRAIDI